MAVGTVLGAKDGLMVGKDGAAAKAPEQTGEKAAEKIAEPAVDGGREVFLDGARAIRTGEELDLAKLEPYLLAKVPGAKAPLSVEQFPSGFSNLTYLLRCGELELVLRRPPFGNRVKSAHDMGREFFVLSRLNPVYPKAPRPYVYCEDEEVIGAPFYVMERRRGVILRRSLPPGLMLPPVLASRLCQSFVAGLAELHQIDYQKAGLGELGKKEGYVERQVRGWIDRYLKSQTDTWPEFEQAGAFLLERREALFPSGEARGALLHNDYKHDNLLLDPNDLTQIIGVFDWEMCTVGEPLLDLGTTLAYWVEPGDDKALRAQAFGPTALPGSLTRMELAARYGEATGADLRGDRLVFAYVFGLYKLGVIVQQIYARYVQGHTRDARFAQLNQLVGLLGRVGAAAIERGTI